MARVRLGAILALILAWAAAVGSAAAERGALTVVDPGLYDRPVLVVDPGVHTTSINQMDADRESRFLVTASDDKTVRVWAATDGKLLRTIRLPAGPGFFGKASAAAVSPDGALIAAGGWTGTAKIGMNVYLFERASGRLLRRVGGLPGTVHDLAFSPDGTRLAAALYSGGVQLIDPATGRVVAVDEDYGDGSYGLAFDAAGRLATTSYDGKVRLYGPDLRPLRTAQAPGGRRPLGIAFSPDGRKLAVGYEDTPAVDVLDGATLERLFAADTAGVNSGKFEANLARVAWSADGSSLYAIGSWNRAREIAVGLWVTGEYLLRRWPEAGRGAPEDRPLSWNGIAHLRPLPGGGLAFATGDPRLGVLRPDGGVSWTVSPLTIGFRGSPLDILAVSSDGAQIAFLDIRWDETKRAWDARPMTFSLPGLRLAQEEAAKNLAPPYAAKSPGLVVENWENTRTPTLNGAPLTLWPYEVARSLAVGPSEDRFVLGTDWNLRLFDRAGTELWRQNSISTVGAVNVSGDGRLVVAAYHDGTIRWHRLEDGTELLAFLPLADRTNWVAWTPDGFYAATPGAYGVLRWHVNRGWDDAPESIPVSDVPLLRRPAVLPLVLQELDVVRALGLAELAEARRAVQLRTNSRVPPGAQLHLLAIGVSAYNPERAAHLRLEFADNDAWDLASALLNTQGSLYAAVHPQVLRDGEATKAGIVRALATVRAGLARGAGQDLAVVHFSGHGDVVDGKLYLLPYEVDAGDPVGIKTTALSIDDLRGELLELAKRGRVLVLLDACRSGAAAAVDAARLRAELAMTNVTVLTSSGGTEASREDPAWGNGAFTEALLEALGDAGDPNRDGLVGVTELAGYLARRVPALTGGAQTPGVEVRYEGGLFAAGL